MHGHGSDAPPRDFSEREAKRVLARAAEIDAGDSVRFSVRELREIAQSAAIAPAAIERALTETAVPEAGGRSSTRWLAAARGLGFIGIGAALGALAALVDGRPLGPELAAAVFGPSAAFVLYRALRHRWHGSLADFLREVTLTMGSFTLTLTAVEGFHATTPALAWTVICAAAGSVVAGIEFRWHPRDAAQPSGDRPEP